MTQKELAYVEDAIGHENNIISICEEMIKNLQDQNLVSFLQNELNGHVSMKNSLMEILEAKSNE